MKTGFVDWYGKWDILPMFITLAYDNFPEVEKARYSGLKIYVVVDKINNIIVFYYF